MLMSHVEDMMYPWAIQCLHKAKLTQVHHHFYFWVQVCIILIGIRNQIFSPIYQNNDGYYALDESFVTANGMIKCDASWTSDVYDNFNQYVRGNWNF